MKKIYISADFEGINGVVNTSQITPLGGFAYEKSRQQLHRELNAVIQGLFSAGINQITINDAHNTMDNILLSEIPDNVRLISGKPKPISMMYGLDSTYDGVFFLGYHVKAGADNGILAHTFNLKFKEVLLNGKPIGEAQLNAIYSTQHNVPVLFASGDDFFCEEIKNDIGDITTITTKNAISKTAAICRCNKELLEEIKHKVQIAASDKAYKAFYEVKKPYTIKICLNESEAFLFSCPNNSKFLNEREIEFISDDYCEIYKFLQFVSGLVISA
ncbi:MAG: M55 family metallopeptidase [Candidatus Gastranaerophilaceae bacterium]|jgi:D-amino peptidase